MTGTSSLELNALLTASEAATSALIEWGIALEARVTALEKPTTGGPACGLPGYTLDWEWTFGPGGKYPTIDSMKADFDSSLPWGRINGEFQRYTDWNAANIQIVGNELHFIATPTRGIGFDQIDSAEIVSHLRYAPPHTGAAAILEFEVKTPAGLGMWPAAWNYDVPGETSDEIDYFEIVYNQADGQRDTTKRVFVNDHVGSGQTPVVTNSKLTVWGGYDAPFDFAQGFHTLATQYEGDVKTRWVDQTAVVTRAWKWLSDPPAIIVNLACGATNPPTDWPGQPNAASFQKGANILALRAVRAWKK